jgi:hypothetical protein
MQSCDIRAAIDSVRPARVDTSRTDAPRCPAMKTVRGHIRSAAWLALFALALQLGLSFGHFHPIAAANSAVAIAQAANQAGGQHHPDPDGLSPDDCDICATIALAGTVVHAVAPELPVPVAFIVVASAQPDVTIAPRAAFVAFNSRAPPSA